MSTATQGPLAQGAAGEGGTFAPLGAGLAVNSPPESALETSAAPVHTGAVRQELNWPPATEPEEDPLEKFELLLQLGRGSYGTVFKARLKDTDEIVAVKIIPVGDSDEARAIQKEIRILQECNHPNIVRYLGSWSSGSALWIGMEYCGGGSVSDLMHAADAPLEEDLIAYICAETLAGLAYLHSMGKVHRDIKCGNVLLTETGEVKLADFGVAAQLTTTMSKRNTFIGTPHWMAPEVIQESRYDGKVDVWALGITAIEMAEMTPPRWAVHPMRVIFMISRDPPPALAQRDRWSLTFQDFVAQSLQKDPRARPTAKHLQQHRFVVASKAGSACANLLPWIRRSRDALVALAAASEKPAGPPGGGQPNMDATGRFSWRGLPPAGAPTGTVAAGVTSGGVGGLVETGTVRGPWAKSGKARARLVGLQYAAEGRTADQESYSGTMVINEDPPEPDSEPSGTVVVRRDAPHSPVPDFMGGQGGTLADGGTVNGPPGMGYGTIVTEDLAEAGDNYQAALQSMAVDRDAGYRQAVNMAAAGAARSSAPHSTAARGLPPIHPNTGTELATQPGTGTQRVQPGVPGLPDGQKQQQQEQHDERERLIARLRGLADGGSVVPIPFLRAADACHSALLHHVAAPYLAAPTEVSSMDCDPERPLEGGEWQQALGVLFREGAVVAQKPSSSKATAQGMAPDECASGRASAPPAVIQQAMASPILLNLARTLAFHSRRLEEQPLMAADHDHLQSSVADMSDALRTILCL